jgi:hypothetical protein
MKIDFHNEVVFYEGHCCQFRLILEIELALNANCSFES